MADVVRQRLVLVLVYVDEVRMAEKLADELVLDRVMQKAIEIATRSLPENPEHEGPPQVHSRTALTAVGAAEETDSHQHFQSDPEFPFRDERANALENFRDIVIRFGIDPNICGRKLAEFHLLRAKISGHIHFLKIHQNLAYRCDKGPCAQIFVSDYRRFILPIHAITFFWRALGSISVSRRIPFHRTWSVV